MRYLYGDSQPFPLAYNFLDALKSLVTNGARAVQLDAQIRGLREANTEAEEARDNAMVELFRFHANVVETLEKAVPSAAKEPTVEYVRQLSELAKRVVEDAKGRNKQANERSQQITKEEVNRRRGEIHVALEALLKVLRLPAKETAISLVQKETSAEVSATYEMEGGITATYTLTTGDMPEWQQACKVAKFAQGLSFPMPSRRGWFQRSVQQEMVGIDEFLLGSFQQEGDDLEIHLKRKVGEDDSIVIKLSQKEDGVHADIEYPESPDSGTTTLDSEALSNVDKLSREVRSCCMDMVLKRGHLIEIRYKGVDVVQEDLARDLLKHILDDVTHTISEIDRRSPNPSELSLKAENDDGRREELYVRKSDLIKPIESLARSERKLFAVIDALYSSPAGEDEIVIDSSPPSESFDDDPGADDGSTNP